jgi:hypothetical protein
MAAEATHPTAGADASTQASQAFVGLFGAVFLRFHRRGAERSAWTSQGWAVLHHLELAGSLTIPEAARHMGRAQSVISRRPAPADDSPPAPPHGKRARPPRRRV